MAEALTRYQRAFRDWMIERGMRFQRIRYQRDEGAWTTEYCMAPARPARGRVVFVHGTGNEALYPQIGLFKRLLLRGFQLRAADLDGHGRTGTGTFDRARIWHAVPQMLGRAGRNGRMPLHAIGESLGAALLLRGMADDAGEGLASAALISPPLGLHLGPGSLAAEAAGLVGRRALRPRRHYGLLGSIPAFGPFRRSTFPIRMEGSGSFGYLEEVQQLLREMDLSRAAIAVARPTLLIAGESDRVVPPRHAARLHELLPESELLRIRDGTHCTTSIAAETEAALVNWIERHTP